MELALLVLGGALVALDGTSIAQTMVSRPFVAATLAGWLVGEPTLGFLAGVGLELITLTHLPIGGTGVPEGAVAGWVGGAAAAWVGTEGGPALGAGTVAPALAAGIVLGVAWGMVGRATTVALRRRTAERAPLPGERTLSVSELIRFHLGALVADFVRGVGVVASGLLVGRIVVPWFAEEWPLGASTTIGLVAMAGALGAGSLFSLLERRSRAGFFLVAGVGVGLLAGGVL